MQQFHLWLNPQNIIALLLMVAGIISYQQSHQQNFLLPEIADVSTINPVIEAETRTITLVSLENDLNNPRVILLEKELFNEAGQAAYSILTELQRNTPRIWIEGLELRRVLGTTILNGQPSLILDFALEKNVHVSIEQEERLYKSIEQTLERNGYRQFFILVNGLSTPVFINHITLPSQLR